MKSKAVMAVAFLAMATFICLVPSDTDAVFTDISGERVIGTGDKEEYTITYTNTDFDQRLDVSMSITYTAKLVDKSGNTVSNGVSPSSGSLENGVSKVLTVTAPSSPGECKLIVTYKAEITYTDDEAEAEGDDDEDDSEVTETLEETDEVNIKVVNPITLSLTLKNDSNIDLNGYGVFFYINGEKMDDSYTTIDLAKEGTAKVTYRWVTDSPNGEYTFKVEPSTGGNLITIQGLDEEHTFYIGDNSYTLWIVLLVLVIVLLALMMVWVYRKPVRNYGKPKSRR